MNRAIRSTLCLLALSAGAVSCGGGGKAKPDMPGPGMNGKGGAMGTTGPSASNPKPMGMNMGIGGNITIGVPTSGSLSTIYPGGGTNGAPPLKPGCTPASAKECPSSSGTCATSATSSPKNVSTGYICYYPTASGSSSTSTKPGMGTTTTTTTTTTVTTTPEATIEYLHEVAGGQDYYRFRITFDPSFVDNTYGANAIGWGTRGHTFNDLVGSDHAQLSLFDGSKTLISAFNLDYISQDTSAACGYSCLGVSGGEGAMLVGDAKYILAATTSLDRDLNGCGYCKNAACNGDCTVDSPATDTKYTPNPLAPNWDDRVVYEVWVSADAFGSNGFGGASITFVHASPSKASSNTITVEPKPCGSCPAGYTNYLTSEGAVCVPVGKTDAGTGGGCPAGYASYLASEGAVCLPVPKGDGGPGGGCPAGYTNYLTSEGAVCVPVPKSDAGTGDGCPAGYAAYLASEGKVCLPIGSHPDAGAGSGGCPAGQTTYTTRNERPVCVNVPSDGVCPNGTSVYQLQGGVSICVPTPGNDGCPNGFTLEQSLCI